MLSAIQTESESGGETVDVDAPPRPSPRSRRCRPVATRRTGGHGRKACPIDGGGANRHPQRTGRRDDIDAGAAESTVRRTHPLGSISTSDTPRPVIQRSVAEEREALRSRVGRRRRPEPGGVVVVASMRKIVLSRWVTTHACAPRKTMSAGPSPTEIRATTLSDDGETRTIAAPWSSATQTVRRRSRCCTPLSWRAGCACDAPRVDRCGRAWSPYQAPIRSRSRQQPRSPVRRGRPSPSCGLQEATRTIAGLLLARNPCSLALKGQGHGRPVRTCPGAGANSLRLRDPPDSATRRRRGQCDARQ